MQSLRVAGRLYPDVSSGEKTSTIRWREPRIVVGPMTFIHHEQPEKTVVVTVTRCTDMKLRKAAELVGRADEWPDEIMLAGMREHYPEIELNSVVQVVEFKLPSQV